MKNKSILTCVAVAALVLVPFLLPKFYVIQFNYIGLSSIVVLGLVLITGIAGLTSFGQAAFVGLGAYTTRISDNRTLTLSLDWSVGRTVHGWRCRFRHRLNHAEALGTLSSLEYDRVEHQSVLPFRKRRRARRAHGHQRNSNGLLCGVQF